VIGAMFASAFTAAAVIGTALYRVFRPLPAPPEVTADPAVVERLRQDLAVLSRSLTPPSEVQRTGG
jgi:hypothetical protein